MKNLARVLSHICGIGIYDAKAQVETGKIDDMLTKLENSVQLDQEINGKAAKICLELKGIEPDNKG